MQVAQVMRPNIQHTVNKIRGSNKKPNNTKNIKINDQEYERIKEFKYPEIVLTDDNEITIEIQWLKTVANKTS